MYTAKTSIQPTLNTLHHIYVGKYKPSIPAADQSFRDADEDSYRDKEQIQYSQNKATYNECFIQNVQPNAGLDQCSLFLCHHANSCHAKTILPQQVFI